jgi:predicted nicotinamide N-methyase
VVQTDRLDAALALGRLNAEQNGTRAIEHRLADWTEWTDTEHYDLILGSDVIYASRLHPSLRAIFDANLASGGRLILTDPFRWPSLALLEAMEADGWSVTVTKWRLDGDWGERLVAGYELSRGTTGVRT